MSRKFSGLLQEFEEHKASGTDEEIRPTSSVLQVRSGRVAIECSASEETERLAADSEGLGITGIASCGSMVGGWLPITPVSQLPELESPRFARAAMATTN